MCVYVIYCNRQCFFCNVNIRVSFTFAHEYPSNMLLAWVSYSNKLLWTPYVVGTMGLEQNHTSTTKFAMTILSLLLIGHL